MSLESLYLYLKTRIRSIVELSTSTRKGLYLTAINITQCLCYTLLYNSVIVLLKLRLKSLYLIRDSEYWEQDKNTPIFLNGNTYP